MTSEKPAPVRSSVVVRRQLDATFAFFVDGLDTWWPLHTHSIAAGFEGRVTVESMTFEKHVGGRVLERMSDGTEAAWGTLLSWEPPHRFLMTWKPTMLDGPPTEVEVRFTAVDADRTRVEVVHRGWELLADAEVKRPAYAQGWRSLLERFRETTEDAHRSTV
jgi:hypothetical protein